MSMKIEKSVYDKLAATAAVTNLVSTKIFFMAADQGTALPYITILRVSTNAPLTSDGPTNIKTTNVTDQIDIWGPSYPSVKEIADAVRDALFGWTDTGADPTVGGSQLTGERDLLEPPIDGKRIPVFRVSMDFSVWFADS
jgi:hypothetical protein|tara:strand:+ start:4478 stop:4897 length:420 start_codon:yes stop_codon:yes gene_type:complete